MEKTAANRRGARSGQVLRALRRGHGASPGWTWPTAELGLGRETPGPADRSQGASPRRCCPGPVRPGGKTGPRPVSSGAARRGRSRAKWASTPARADVCANRTALAGSDTAEPDEGPGRHEHRGGGSAPRGHPRGGPGATTGRPLRARLLTRCRRVGEGRVPPRGTRAGRLVGCSEQSRGARARGGRRRRPEEATPPLGPRRLRGATRSGHSKPPPPVAVQPPLRAPGARPPPRPLAPRDPEPRAPAAAHLAHRGGGAEGRHVHRGPRGRRGDRGRLLSWGGGAAWPGEESRCGSRRSRPAPGCRRPLRRQAPADQRSSAGRRGPRLL